MPHVITQSCTSDASCVFACPVNCIQPTPDDPAYLLAEMLYIDPRSCVDCGACVDACPVDAIKTSEALTEAELPFLGINADWHEANRDRRPRPIQAPVPARLEVRGHLGPLRVAIVGSGPSAMYAADELLTIAHARVSMYERLDQPYGLARFGVAPDHPRTRRVTRQFEQIRASPRLTLHTGVHVGVDITHAQLLETHDAVIYAVGAASDKRLALPGIDLPGVASATSFVAWYNGHPDYAGAGFDLSHSQAVVIGNGNVALDVARILTTDPDRLADTDIAPAALRALRASKIEEVVVTGRRGPEHAAFTLPELLGLSSAPGVDLRFDAEDASRAVKLATIPARDRTGGRRVTLAFNLTPTAVLGDDHVTGVEFGDRQLQAGLVLTSIGYGALPVADLPFDDETRTVPHDRGRVKGRPRTYVTGWIKRGPSGFIGTNRSDSQETVRTLVDDYNAGRLGRAAVLL